MEAKIKIALIAIISLGCSLSFVVHAESVEDKMDAVMKNYKNEDLIYSYYDRLKKIEQSVKKEKVNAYYSIMKSLVKRHWQIIAEKENNILSFFSSVKNYPWKSIIIYSENDNNYLKDIEKNETDMLSKLSLIYWEDISWYIKWQKIIISKNLTSSWFSYNWYSYFNKTSWVTLPMKSWNIIIVDEKIVWNWLIAHELHHAVSMKKWLKLWYLEEWFAFFSMSFFEWYPISVKNDKIAMKFDPEAYKDKSIMQEYWISKVMLYFIYNRYWISAINDILLNATQWLNEETLILKSLKKYHDYATFDDFYNDFLLNYAQSSDIIESI